jgi:hypothetical protein
VPVKALSVEPVPTGVQGFPTYVDSYILAAGVARRAAIPAGYRFVDFQTDLDFYAKPGDVTVNAVVAVGDVTDGTASEFNPKWRSVGGGFTHISIISASAGIVTLAWHGA